MEDKRFVRPELNIIEFLKEDIIITSGEDEWWADEGSVGVIDGPSVP